MLKLTIFKLLSFHSACNCISPWLEMLLHRYVIMIRKLPSLKLKLQRPRQNLHIQPQINPSVNLSHCIRLWPAPPLSSSSSSSVFLLCFRFNNLALVLGTQNQRGIGYVWVTGRVMSQRRYRVMCASEDVGVEPERVEGLCDPWGVHEYKKRLVKIMITCDLVVYTNKQKKARRPMIKAEAFPFLCRVPIWTGPFDSAKRMRRAPLRFCVLQVDHTTPGSGCPLWRLGRGILVFSGNQLRNTTQWAPAVTVPFSLKAALMKFL